MLPKAINGCRKTHQYSVLSEIFISGDRRSICIKMMNQNSFKYCFYFNFLYLTFDYFKLPLIDLCLVYKISSAFGFG